MFKIGGENKQVRIIATMEGLSTVEEVIPKPTKKFIPDWWKELAPANNKTEKSFKIDAGNVKNCPSFPDYFSSGFIVPMWCDTILRYNKNSNTYDFEVSNKDFIVETHGNQQFVDIVPSFNYLGKTASFVFKFVCPWQVITEPGWSLLQLPAFYHFNNEFTVLPGIIDTDVHHEINQQIILLNPKEEIFIPMGTPLAQYIPFKREKIETVVTEPTKKDFKILNRQRLRFRSQFIGSKQYNSMRRSREKNEN